MHFLHEQFTHTSPSATPSDAAPAIVVHHRTQAQRCDYSPVIRTRSEECVRDGVSYRVETTWDNETGNAEIREFSLNGALVHRCDWQVWPEPRGDQIGEAIWFDASEGEMERRPLREHRQGS